MADALCASDLWVERGRRSVLEGVALRAQHGEILAVLGPNGAGKSTLLHCLSGLLAHRGRVLIEGHELASMSLEDRARRLAFVPQHTALRSALPVRTVVLHGRYAHRGGLRNWTREDRHRSEQAMERVDVARLAERPFTELSFGEQRRVMLARALATGARVLCLDEPTASLDIGHALRFYELLHQLAGEGQAVIAVLHQLDDALRVSQHALLLSDGRCIANGPTPEVVAPGPVRQAYGVEMRHGSGLQFELVGEAAPNPHS